MGRHELPRNRRKPSVVLAAVLAPAAAFLVAGGSAHRYAVDPPAIDPPAVADAAEPVVEEALPCCLEIVAAPIALSSAPFVGQAGMGAAPGQLVSASRWRTARVDRTLPAGVAPERGLQIRTILAARSISAAFPEIQNIGGVRPDALRWHPNGLALDVMIPNPGSAEGIALGNQIVAFALKNAARFGLQDAIWRGIYYTPKGPRGTGAGHYDHVHITTTGGGYPTGGETYFR